MGEARTRDDVLAGVVFLVFGGAFAFASARYEVGSLFRMGPGYFPLLLGIILAAFGVAIIVTALAARRGIVPMAEAPADAVDVLTDTPPAPAEPVGAGTEAGAGTAAGVGAVAGRGTVAGGATSVLDEDEDEDFDAVRGSVPWVRGGLVIAAILLFGFAISGLGLLPALFVTALLTALAGYGTSIKAALVISVGLTGLCIVIFVLLLQLRLPLIGPWLGG